MKAASLSLQLIGIAFAVVGVGVVRARIAEAAAAAAALARDAARSAAEHRSRLSRWWTRRRGRPVHIEVTAQELAGTSDLLAGATVIHPQVDRATVSERDWLHYLDDRVETLQDQLDQAAQARHAANRQWAEQLATQRANLLGAIESATRQGWRLVLTGLMLSGVGTVLGFWA